MTAALAAAAMLLAQATAPPPASPTPNPDVVQTQPASPSPAPTPESTGEEPQTGPAPADVQGQGAEAQEAWEARLHAAYDNAEARQGPLDGRWRLAGVGGDELFVFVLSDTGAPDLVGAWRDVRRGGGSDGSGYLSITGRTADGIAIRFTEPGASAETIIQLRPTADGSWGGEMTESGAVRSVAMSRF